MVVAPKFITCLQHRQFPRNTPHNFSHYTSVLTKQLWLTATVDLQWLIRKSPKTVITPLKYHRSNINYICDVFSNTHFQLRNHVPKGTTPPKVQTGSSGLHIVKHEWQTGNHCTTFHLILLTPCKPVDWSEKEGEMGRFPQCSYSWRMERKNNFAPFVKFLTPVPFPNKGSKTLGKIIHYFNKLT